MKQIGAGRPMDKLLRSDAIAVTRKISREDLASFLFEMQQFHGQEMEIATANLWWDDLKHLTRDELYGAWREYRQVNTYAPRVSDLLSIISRYRERPSEWHSPTVADRRASEEARESPEAKQFFETLGRMTCSSEIPQKGRLVPRLRR